MCDFIFELPRTSVEILCAAAAGSTWYVKTSISLISYYTETTRTTYDTRFRYQIPGICSKQQFVAGTPIVLLYEKSDGTVRIEPRPPSPNTCRLCARSSRTLFRSQAGGDGTRMQGVLGESRQSIVSALY